MPRKQNKILVVNLKICAKAVPRILTKKGINKFYFQFSKWKSYQA